MKARIKNNRIILYNNLPRKFQGVNGTTLGGYNKLPNSIHEADGFFDVIVPEYDNILQYLSEIYFNEENKYFTYDIIDKVFNIDNEKIKKVKELKKLTNEFFQLTDWYYIREKRRGIPVPSEIQNYSDLLYYRVDEIENEINNLNNIKDILTYEINLDI